MSDQNHTKYCSNHAWQVALVPATDQTPQALVIYPDGYHNNGSIQTVNTSKSKTSKKVILANFGNPVSSFTDRFIPKTKSKTTKVETVIKHTIVPDHKLQEQDLKDFFVASNFEEKNKFLVQDIEAYHIKVNSEHENISVKPFFICKHESFIGWEKTENNGQTIIRPVVSIKNIADFDEIYSKLTQIYEYFNSTKPNYTGKQNKYLFMNINLEPSHNANPLICYSGQEEAVAYMMALDCLVHFVRTHCNDPKAKIMLKGPAALNTLFTDKKKPASINTKEDRKKASDMRLSLITSLGGTKALTKLKADYASYIIPRKIPVKDKNIVQKVKDMTNANNYYPTNFEKGDNIMPYTMIGSLLHRTELDKDLSSKLNSIAENVPVIYYDKLVEYDPSIDSQINEEKANIIKVRLYTSSEVGISNNTAYAEELRNKMELEASNIELTNPAQSIEVKPNSINSDSPINIETNSVPALENKENINILTVPDLSFD